MTTLRHADFGRAELISLVRTAMSRASFWVVVPAITLLAAVYFYVVADPLYVSEAVISIRHKTSMAPGVGAILGNLSGSVGSTEEDAALSKYIVSHEMLDLLNNRFDLRKAYSSEPSNPFTRLRASASNERFLTYYRDMIELDVRYDMGIITVRVLDFDAKRARDVNQMIIAQSEAFLNAQSEAMMAASLRFARNELNAAIAASDKAQPYERQAADLRLQAAQAGLATVSSMAGQQQVFVVPISNPSLPTISTRPERLLDTLVAAILAGILYVVASLLFAAIRDHHKV